MSLRRPLLLPLTPLYAAALAWKNLRLNRSEPDRLDWPVISVGSLSTGGAGKTPFVLALARLLQDGGFAVDVLSRGYGRDNASTLRVDPAGQAARFGDEPLLLARQLGCPVYVGPRRFDAGRLAEAAFEKEPSRTGSPAKHVHLLDDGFSHRRLARAVDIVLLTAEDLRDHLLPAGNRREPLHALTRASVIVLRAEESRELQAAVLRLASGSGSAGPTPVWTVDRTTGILDGPPPRRPLAFCAIARPDDFAQSLERIGVAPVQLRRFRDHHAYTDADMTDLVRRARAAGADGFVTTAKDAVKLSPAMRQRLQTAGPLSVADVRVTFREPEQALDLLRQVLAPRG